VIALSKIISVIRYILTAYELQLLHTSLTLKIINKASFFPFIFFFLKNGFVAGERESKEWLELIVNSTVNHIVHLGSS